MGCFKTKPPALACKTSIRPFTRNRLTGPLKVFANTRAGGKGIGNESILRYAAVFIRSCLRNRRASGRGAADFRQTPRTVFRNESEKRRILTSKDTEIRIDLIVFTGNDIFESKMRLRFYLIEFHLLVCTRPTKRSGPLSRFLRSSHTHRSLIVPIGRKYITQQKCILSREISVRANECALRFAFCTGRSVIRVAAVTLRHRLDSRGGSRALWSQTVSHGFVQITWTIGQTNKRLFDRMKKKTNTHVD